MADNSDLLDATFILEDGDDDDDDDNFANYWPPSPSIGRDGAEGRFSDNISDVLAGYTATVQSPQPHADLDCPIVLTGPVDRVPCSILNAIEEDEEEEDNSFQPANEEQTGLDDTLEVKCDDRRDHGG